MKKILFSLAALAAISVVAVGCKKATDSAKDERPVEMKEITDVKTAFAALKEACKADKCKTEADVKTICGNPAAGGDCLLKKFEDAVKAAEGKKVTGIVETDLATLKTKATEANLWVNKSSGSGKEVSATALNAVNTELTNLEDKVNALKAPAGK